MRYSTYLAKDTDTQPRERCPHRVGTGAPCTSTDSQVPLEVQAQSQAKPYPLLGKNIQVNTLFFSNQFFCFQLQRILENPFPHRFFTLNIIFKETNFPFWNFFTTSFCLSHFSHKFAFVFGDVSFSALVRIFLKYKLNSQSKCFVFVFNEWIKAKLDWVIKWSGIVAKNFCGCFIHQLLPWRLGVLKRVLFYLLNTKEVVPVLGQDVSGRLHIPSAKDS